MDGLDISQWWSDRKTCASVLFASVAILILQRNQRLTVYLFETTIGCGYKQNHLSEFGM